MEDIFVDNLAAVCEFTVGAKASQDAQVEIQQPHLECELTTDPLDLFCEMSIDKVKISPRGAKIIQLAWEIFEASMEPIIRKEIIRGVELQIHKNFEIIKEMKQKQKPEAKDEL